MDQMFSYRALVFRLLGGKYFSDALEVRKLLQYRSVIISEHDPCPNEDCEWQNLHYHGLVENQAQYRFDSDRIFNQIKGHCEFFKSEACKLPVNYLAYMQLGSKKIVYTNERGPSDLSMLQAQITPELIAEVGERKKTRIQNKIEGGQDIMKIKDYILEHNAQSESELMNKLYHDEEFQKIYCKRTFSTNFRKALSFANQSVLDKDILNLNRDFTDPDKLCMNAHRSANLMEEWCKFQDIDPWEFATNMVMLMDKKQRKLNTIILRGAPNSGKTFIAKSLMKSCIFYGEICQGLAGYSFMYQDCVNKRVIIINEPFFDNCMIEQLKTVMEGVGTFVHKKNASDEYLRPTPVLITTNNHVWASCPSAEKAIKARCIAIYDNLKACPLLKSVRKDLHPRWINIILQRNAPIVPISEFEDSSDECTSQDLDSVARGQTSKSPIKKEVPPTDSTPSVELTTSRPLTWAPKKRTHDFYEKHPKKVCLETYSPASLQVKEICTNSQEEDSCQGVQTPTTSDEEGSSKLHRSKLPVKRRLILESDQQNEDQPSSKKLSLCLEEIPRSQWRYLKEDPEELRLHPEEEDKLEK